MLFSLSPTLYYREAKGNRLECIYVETPFIAWHNIIGFSYEDRELLKRDFYK